MQTKVLLVNFGPSEQKRMASTFPEVLFESGYFGEQEEIDELVEGPDFLSYARTDTVRHFYFEHPIYEYEVAVFNLTGSSAPYGDDPKKLHRVSQGFRNEMLRFWTQHRKKMVVFVGQTGEKDLEDLGIAGVELESVLYNDSVVKIGSIRSAANEMLLEATLKQVKNQINLPTTYYLRLSKEVVEKQMYNGSTSPFGQYRGLFFNSNGKALGSLCYAEPKYVGGNEPLRYQYFLLPGVRDRCEVLKVLLPTIVADDPPTGLATLNWIDSDNYYPNEMSLLADAKIAFLEEARSRFNDFEKQRNGCRERYRLVRSLLHTTGSPLKTAVQYVLGDLLGLVVQDRDQARGTTLLNEDLLVEIGTRKILIEVKGDGRSTPGAEHAIQVWRQVNSYAKNGEAEGMLILNYDYRKEPKLRSMAYKGEQEDSIASLIFLDTRVLFDVAVAVIDGVLPIQEAITILFPTGGGRVLFDRQDHIESSSTIGQSEVKEV